jgi:hypothetical protein
MFISYSVRCSHSVIYIPCCPDCCSISVTMVMFDDFTVILRSTVFDFIRYSTFICSRFVPFIVWYFLRPAHILPFIRCSDLPFWFHKILHSFICSTFYISFVPVLRGDFTFPDPAFVLPLLVLRLRFLTSPHGPTPGVRSYHTAPFDLDLFLHFIPTFGGGMGSPFGFLRSISCGWISTVISFPWAESFPVGIRWFPGVFYSVRYSRAWPMRPCSFGDMAFSGVISCSFILVVDWNLTDTTTVTHSFGIPSWVCCPWWSVFLHSFIRWGPYYVPGVPVRFYKFRFHHSLICSFWAFPENSVVTTTSCSIDLFVVVPFYFLNFLHHTFLLFISTLISFVRFRSGDPVRSMHSFVVHTPRCSYSPTVRSFYTRSSFGVVLIHWLRPLRRFRCCRSVCCWSGRSVVRWLPTFVHSSLIPLHYIRLFPLLFDDVWGPFPTSVVGNSPDACSVFDSFIRWSTFISTF